MARKSTKHANQQVIVYNDFSAGLNLTASPDLIAANELSRAENVEYDTLDNSITKSPGLVCLYDAQIPIDSLFPINATSALFSSGTNLYLTNYSAHSLLGALTGGGRPVYVTFGTDVLIASGGKLQKYDGATLATITASHNASFVFARFGRVVTGSSDSDTLYYSGIGDATNWTENANDDSAAKYVQIGYKDSGSIVCVANLFQDLIVFKDNDKAFRLVGEFPNWQVLELAKDANCCNARSAVSATNMLFYLGKMGMQAIATTQQYGDMQTVNVGAKINNYLAANTNNGSAAVWHLSSRRQIWVLPQDSGLVYIYHTTTGAVTMRRMDTSPTDVRESGNDVYLSRGTKILELRPDMSTDDGADFTGIIHLKEIRGANEILIKRVVVDVYSSSSGNASLAIGDWSMQVNRSSSGEIAALDTDIAALDDDPVILSSYTTTDKSGNYRVKRVNPTLTVSSGNLSLRRAAITIAEVG